MLHLNLAPFQKRFFLLTCLSHDSNSRDINVLSTRVHLDTQGLKVRYPELYIPSDVAHVVRHGVDIFRDRDVLPFIKPARFHVLDSLNVRVNSVGSRTMLRQTLILSHALK